MRLAIIAFAVGVWLFQTQARLPSPVFIAVLAALAVLVFVLIGRISRRLRPLLIIFCGAAFGFAWSASMATLRMADQLPTAWEARDIVLTGVVASLPQRFERGERFEFDVESVQTDGAVVPRRILLAWYRGRPWPIASSRKMRGLPLREVRLGGKPRPVKPKMRASCRHADQPLPGGSRSEGWLDGTRP